MQNDKWKLQGYDTFAHESYPLDGDFDTENDAIAAAKAYLDDLEKTQPSESSGGQGGIQDGVYVIRPDGTAFKVMPNAQVQQTRLAVEKSLGNVPLGVEAPNKTFRKLIGGGWELLHVVKFGLFGALLSLLGIVSLYVSLAGKTSFKVSAIGAVMLVVGVWLLRLARKAYRVFRAISKA